MEEKERVGAAKNGEGRNNTKEQRDTGWLAVSTVGLYAHTHTHTEMFAQCVRAMSMVFKTNKKEIRGEKSATKTHEMIRIKRQRAEQNRRSVLRACVYTCCVARRETSTCEYVCVRGAGGQSCGLGGEGTSFRFLRSLARGSIGWRDSQKEERKGRRK
jgi:hypothetical protein